MHANKCWETRGMGPDVSGMEQHQEQWVYCLKTVGGNYCDVNLRRNNKYKLATLCSAFHLHILLFSNKNNLISLVQLHHQPQQIVGRFQQTCVSCSYASEFARHCIASLAVMYIKLQFSPSLLVRPEKAFELPLTFTLP